jgi:hypothetical protein
LRRAVEESAAFLISTAIATIFGAFRFGKLVDLSIESAGLVEQRIKLEFA